MENTEGEIMLKTSLLATDVCECLWPKQYNASSYMELVELIDLLSVGFSILIRIEVYFVKINWQQW